MLKDTGIATAPAEDSAPEEFPRPRRAAVGKALIVWLATGSLGAAVVAFLIFKGLGC